MSIKESAAKIADRLRTMDYADVYSHHDADGIAAAAILCIALQRANIAFRLRFLPHLKAEDVERPEISILCDLGASESELSESVIIIDHHIPYAKTPYHINPRLEGLDGETELSAAGCAYLVAAALDRENRDLAGLVLAGILGDNQKVSGMNQTIIDEAIGDNLIVPGKGILLPGRTTREQIEIAALPYLPGVSGDAVLAEKIQTRCQETTTDEAYAGLFLSEIILRSSASASSLERIYGDSWKLLRETIQDAHSLAAVIDACGKSGRADLGFAVAAGDAAKADEAWNTAAAFRKHILENAAAAQNLRPSVWEVSDADAASDVADLLAADKNCPVIVIGKAPAYLKVSARAPQDADVDFEQFMKTSAEKFGGAGGGHKTRAGGELPLECQEEFLSTIPEFA
ncbi:MAG: DHHA1 domain-containing protein [Lachnospiraceae bacterium]|nr:DHHA1 domain-containing protein [Lachnospiraceae bacterium]